MPWHLSRQAVAEGFGDGFGFGVDVKLVVDVTKVELDGVDGDASISLGQGVFFNR